MSGLTPSQKESLLRQVREITSCSKVEGQKALKSTGYNLERSVDLLLSNGPSSGANAAVDANKLAKLWSKYEDKDALSTIGIDGIINYCKDLEIEPDDLKFMVLSFHLHSPRIGLIEKKGFLEGWQKLGQDTIDGQRKVVRGFDLTLKLPLDHQDFRNVYQYAFVFARPEGQKSLPLESAIDFWTLLIGTRFSGLDSWTTFLQDKGIKVISRDTWNLFLDFARQIDPQFSNYDENAAWPSLIDDYVEHSRERLRT